MAKKKSDGVGMTSKPKLTSDTPEVRQKNAAQYKNKDNRSPSVKPADFD